LLPCAEWDQGVRLELGAGVAAAVGLGEGAGPGDDDLLGDGEAAGGLDGELVADGVGDAVGVSPLVSPVGLSVPGAELPAVNV
jgi:hypothetical protein